MKQQLSIKPLYLLLFLWLSCTAASSKEESTRSALPAAWERLLVVERHYGEHNVNVRKNIRKLEDRMHRYQTGLAPDPSHRVNYENHPFEKRRQLQGNSTSRFAPIRMHFETISLDQRVNWEPYNKLKIESFKREVLPRTRDLWQKAVAVVQAESFGL